MTWRSGWLGLVCMTACVAAPELPEMTGLGAPGSTSASDETGTAGEPTNPLRADGGPPDEGGSTGANESTDTGLPIECGDDAVQGDEQCDGADLGGQTCESLGLSGGGLACTSCLLDLSGCGPPLGMVAVPGGVFEMGSTTMSDEQPVRQVQVDRFWIDQTEVTVSAYSSCVTDGACSAPGTGTYCNWMVAGREDHPINCVDWALAEAYCAWADGGNKRLPTEAEWEKAARGTDARTYPWGNDPAPSCDVVVMDTGCGMSSTWPVASKPMGDSPYEAQDLLGNIQEWVSDWYGPYDETQTDNPTGPATGTLRSIRGNGWTGVVPLNFRAPDRYGLDPTNASETNGFRCARTPPAAPGG